MQNNNRLKISREMLKLILLLFPLIQPASEALKVLLGYTLGNIVHYVIMVWDYCSITYILCSFMYKLLKKGYKSIKNISWFIFFLSIWLITVTVKTGGAYSWQYVVKLFLNLIAMVWIVELYEGKKIYIYLQAIYYYLTIVAVISSLAIYCFYPRGIYQGGLNKTNSNYYLYGLDNVSFIYALHGFCAGILYYVSQKKRVPIRFIIVYVAVAGAYLYCGAGTGTFVALLCVGILCVYRLKILSFVNYRNTILLCIFMFVFICFVQSFSAFNNIFVMLGKDSSLGTRVQIWAAAFKAIPENWVMGVGISTDVVQSQLLKNGLSWARNIGHLHNIIIELIFKGGVILLTAFSLMWLKCYKQMMEYSDSLVAVILCITMLLSWLTCLFEFRFDTYTFWIIPTMMYNVCDIAGVSQHEVEIKKYESNTH